MGEAARRKKLGVENSHNRDLWILKDRGAFTEAMQDIRKADYDGKQFNAPVVFGHNAQPRIPTEADIDKVMGFDEGVR